VERQETIQYNERRKADAPFITNRIVLHRLRLATNGNDTYQLMVSSNYLKGTEGFPKDTNLAAYWYDQYQKNTNKVVRSK
jgi:TPR repeat protein